MQAPQCTNEIGDRWEGKRKLFIRQFQWYATVLGRKFMKFMGKVCGTLPGKENLNVTKSKEVNLLFLGRDGKMETRQKTTD